MPVIPFCRHTVSTRPLAHGHLIWPVGPLVWHPTVLNSPPELKIHQSILANIKIFQLAKLFFPVDHLNLDHCISLAQMSHQLPNSMTCLFFLPTVPAEGHAGAVRGGPGLPAVSRLPRQVQHQEDEEVSGSIYQQQNRFKLGLRNSVLQSVGSMRKLQLNILWAATPLGDNPPFAARDLV